RPAPRGARARWTPGAPVRTSCPTRRPRRLRARHGLRSPAIVDTTHSRNVSNRSNSVHIVLASNGSRRTRLGLAPASTPPTPGVLRLHHAGAVKSILEYRTACAARPDLAYRAPGETPNRQRCAARVARTRACGAGCEMHLAVIHWALGRTSSWRLHL